MHEYSLLTIKTGIIAKKWNSCAPTGNPSDIKMINEGFLVIVTEKKQTTAAPISAIMNIMELSHKSCISIRAMKMSIT